MRDHGYIAIPKAILNDDRITDKTCREYLKCFFIPNYKLHVTVRTMLIKCGYATEVNGEFQLTFDNVVEKKVKKRVLTPEYEALNEVLESIVNEFNRITSRKIISTSYNKNRLKKIINTHDPNVRKEGKYTYGDIINVIRLKWTEWRGTDMEQYIRTLETVCRPKNFGRYLEFYDQLSVEDKKKVSILEKPSIFLPPKDEPAPVITYKR